MGTARGRRSGLAFNDVQSSEIVASMLGDVDRSTRALAVALERRIADRWSVNIESIYLLNIDRAEIHYEIRRDSFIDLSLVYNF